MLKKVFIFFCFIFAAVLWAQKDSYVNYLEKAEKLKETDWKKAELNIEIAEKTVPEQDLGNFYFEASKIYKGVERFDEALEYAVKAHTIFTEEKDEDKLVKIDALFAFIYSQMNDTKRAISYYKRLLKYYTSKNNDEYIIKSLNNIGNGYISLNKLDSAQYYFQESLPLFEKYNNPVLKAFIFSNIGKLNFFKGNVTNSENYLLEAKTILDKNKITDKDTNYTINYNLANFYISTENAEQSMIFAQELGKYVDGKSATFDNVNYLKILYESYLLNEDYKNAALAFQKYDAFRNQLNIEMKAVNIERVKVQHDYELKKKIEDLEQNRKNTLYIILFILLVLITVICVLLLINYRNKAEKLRLENKLIEEREKQLDTDNQMKEKMLVQKSMEQSRIEEIFKSILERLNKLKEKHNGSYINEVSDIVNEIKLSSNQNIWAGFEYHFLNIHESFYKNLDEKHPGLTNYDKKLAAMLKLKLSTKEISDILNVTPRTIENSRTRLRKKINLTNSKEDLAKYLDQF